MSSEKSKPWDGKCPHCGDKRKIFPTGRSITPMDPNLPTREVLICNYCYKTFQIYDKIERIPMLCLENIGTDSN